MYMCQSNTSLGVGGVRSKELYLQGCLYSALQTFTNLLVLFYWYDRQLSQITTRYFTRCLACFTGAMLTVIREITFSLKTTKQKQFRFSFSSKSNSQSGKIGCYPILHASSRSRPDMSYTQNVFSLWKTVKPHFVHFFGGNAAPAGFSFSRDIWKIAGIRSGDDAAGVLRGAVQHEPKRCSDLETHQRSVFTSAMPTCFTTFDQLRQKWLIYRLCIQTPYCRKIPRTFPSDPG